MSITMQATMVFYVPPHKLHATLADMQDVLGGTRLCCVAREVTKKFEQFLRGTIDSVVDQLGNDGVKGEITLFVEGSNDAELNTNHSPQVTALRPNEYETLALRKEYLYTGNQGRTTDTAPGQRSQYKGCFQDSGRGV